MIKVIKGDKRSLQVKKANKGDKRLFKIIKGYKDLFFVTIQYY